MESLIVCTRSDSAPNCWKRRRSRRSRTMRSMRTTVTEPRGLSSPEPMAKVKTQASRQPRTVTVTSKTPQASKKFRTFGHSARIFSTNSTQKSSRKQLSASQRSQRKPPAATCTSTPMKTAFARMTRPKKVSAQGDFTHGVLCCCCSLLRLWSNASHSLMSSPSSWAMLRACRRSSCARSWSCRAVWIRARKHNVMPSQSWSSHSRTPLRSSSPSPAAWARSPSFMMLLTTPCRTMHSALLCCASWYSLAASCPTWMATDVCPSPLRASRTSFSEPALKPLSKSRSRKQLRASLATMCASLCLPVMR
mmetsp:Transcript_43630/g.132059  ORF Transcript_43630/g.132059 Transcript_43630/m.132059 type:complete len:307 (-) Transcript_43630:165-1085(-)